MADFPVLGVDTGGTFTDFVLRTRDGERIHKVLSTPQAPEQAILQGIHELGLDDALANGHLLLVHGTTVATNAALQGRGARTLLITNDGLQDVLAIGRQARQHLYDLTPPAEPRPLPPEHIVGVSARLDATGAEVAALTDQDLADLDAAISAVQPEAVAVSLLFSYLNPGHEQRIAAHLAASGAFVCHSAEVLPLSGEYERTLATWLNAWLGPEVARYLERLRQAVGRTPVSLMQSHGGTVSLASAARRAVSLLLSGPAGGLSAARQLGEDLGRPRLLTFDMGGTSTDVALLDQGLRITLEGRVGPYPVAVPMVDMQTLGAGGGSLARVDDAGMLHVGPQSAGANPGPACYGRGGHEATVTDAHAVLGRLPASTRLGGELPLDVDAAQAALARLGEAMGQSAEQAARGVLAVANAHMAQALRVISIQRGVDPSDFTLVSFGGAGGLHVCDLADALGIREALVPRQSGVLSAQGLTWARQQREQVQSLPNQVSDAELTQQAQRLQQQVLQALAQEEQLAVDELTSELSVDLCYQGQSFPLTIPWHDHPDALEQAFHNAHQARYGHRLDGAVRRVNLRARAAAPALLRTTTVPLEHSNEAPSTSEVAGLGPVPVWTRAALEPGRFYQGPIVVTDAVATVWVAAGWQVTRDQADHLLLQAVSAGG